VSIVGIVRSREGTDDTLDRTTFTVVDAGGSTVDTALFVVNETSPRLSLTNAKASESVLGELRRRIDDFLD
jgi:hypothetical protein